MTANEMIRDIWMWMAHDRIQSLEEMLAKLVHKSNVACTCACCKAAGPLADERDELKAKFEEVAQKR